MTVFRKALVYFASLAALREELTSSRFKNLITVSKIKKKWYIHLLITDS